MNRQEKSKVEQLYGLPSLDAISKDYNAHFSKKNKPFLKSNFIVDSFIFYMRERLSIDSIIKELAFVLVAIATYLFMQKTGRFDTLQGFGSLIGITLLVAMVYNLFKASMKSLAPGVLCLVGGLVLLSPALHVHYFKFISKETIDYIIGTGAFFIGLSLFKSESD